MNTVFPEELGLNGMFIIGYKKQGLVNVQTGTVIVKRGYRIESVSNMLIPVEDRYPVFVKDSPFNVVQNGSFENPANGPPANWEGDDGITIQTDTSGTVPFISVRGPAGGGKIIQTITCDEPLGGKPFVFSFWVRSSNSSAHIENIRLESNGSRICSMTVDPGGNFQRYSGQGVWPTGLESTEMDVVLMTTDIGGISIDYAGIQVEEGTYLTRWNPESVLKYEHDLASHKVDADIIIHGFSDKTGTHSVKVNGETWFSTTLPRSDPGNPFITMSGARPKSFLGWEQRLTDPRKAEGGDFEVWADDPAEPPLPADFMNIYYNGYLRDARVVSSKNQYLPPGAHITVERPLVSAYSITLPEDVYNGSYFYTRPSQPDDKDHWGKTPFSLHADTLVIEPEKQACYIVWRGHWHFTDHPEDSYRLLEVFKSIT